MNDQIPGFTPPTPEQDRRITAIAAGFTIEFDINELINAIDPHAMYRGHNWETEEDYFEPASLKDLIVTQVAEKLAKALQKQVADEISAAVRERVLAEVRDRVRTALEEGSLQPTDEWGRKKGEAKPLVDVILETAGEVLTKPMGDSYSRNRSTVLQKMVEDAVGKAFKAELQEVVNQARNAAKQAVKESASQVIAETIERASRGL